MRQSNYTRGSALLVVLWVIALLSFLIITSMMVVMQDVETVAARRMAFRARQLAEAGLAIGANPLIKPGDPLLRKNMGYAESYEVNITTEESRLNIGALLTEERRVVLERLFASWGLRPLEAQAAVDALMDWVDADDFKRLTGAERADYKKDGFNDRPYNRPFQSLDEVPLVRGMEFVMQANPAWRNAFTLWGAGALDINEAPAELIAIVADVPLNSAQTLVAARNGPDGIPHTDDDQPMQSIDEAMVLLGATATTPTTGTGLFTLKGTIARVDSIGRAGNYARRISVVLRKGVDAMMSQSVTEIPGRISVELRKGVDGRSPIMEWRESAGN